MISFIAALLFSAAVNLGKTIVMVGTYNTLRVDIKNNGTKSGILIHSGLASSHYTNEGERWVGVTLTADGGSPPGGGVGGDYVRYPTQLRSDDAAL